MLPIFFLLSVVAATPLSYRAFLDFTASGANALLKDRGLTGYSPADVASHNTATDCWVILNNYVLDVTAWMGNGPGTHPAGPSGILPYAGKDLSTPWSAVQEHPPFTALAKYDLIKTVGTIQTSATSPTSSPTIAVPPKSTPTPAPAAASSPSAKEIVSPTSPSAAIATTTDDGTLTVTSTTHVPSSTHTAGMSFKEFEALPQTQTLSSNTTNSPNMTATTSSTGTSPSAVEVVSTPAYPGGSCSRGTSYTVVAADTCWAISQSYGITLDALEALNPGICGVSMKVGAMLCIPAVAGKVDYAAATLPAAPTGSVTQPSSCLIAGDTTKPTSAFTPAGTSAGTASSATSVIGSVSNAASLQLKAFTPSSYLNPPIAV